MSSFLKLKNQSNSSFQKQKMFEELNTPEEEKNFIPKDLEEFSKFLIKKSIQDTTITKPEYCLICSDLIKTNVKIERKCQCSTYPCEGHICECSSKNPYPCCFNCISKHLWEKSSAKFIGRFRAKCPFCKSEFCQNDLILIKFKQEKSTNCKKKKNQKNFDEILEKFIKSEEKEFCFDKNLTSFDRKKVHGLAEKKNLNHISEENENQEKILKISKK